MPSAGGKGLAQKKGSAPPPPPPGAAPRLFHAPGGDLLPRDRHYVDSVDTLHVLEGLVLLYAELDPFLLLVLGVLHPIDYVVGDYHSGHLVLHVPGRTDGLHRDDTR